MTDSPFAKFTEKAWPHRFEGTLTVPTLVGGIPTDPNVAEAWLRSKLADSDDLIRAQVAETMTERGVGVDEATEIVNANKHLNGFKRDQARGGELYIEGRQLKAALKEAASVAVAAGKLDARGWGKTNKGLLGFLAEHVSVTEDRIYLGVTKPTGILQRFVHTFRGSGIQYEEYVEDAEITFTVRSDWPFTDEQWAMIWLTGQEQGIGASRSQGYGRYTVTRWEQTTGGKRRVSRVA
ncbi:MAG TPA: hypothetical protein VGL39_27715 [Jatrophihabitantaceae bacterium]|jgi:hypothetical protein